MIFGLPIGMLQSNCYVVYDERDKVGAIIDPGGKVEPLLDEIERRGITPRYLLNTHGHFDHIAANTPLTQRFELQVGLHPADAELLARGGGASWYNLAYIPAPAPTLELTDGLELALGTLTLTVIHTPGHTPGSVCFYCPADQALITGDTLFAGSVGRTDLPGGSAQALSASLKRLLALPSETQLYPGHGPVSTLAHERRHNPWLQRLPSSPQ